MRFRRESQSQTLDLQAWHLVCLMKDSFGHCVSVILNRFLRSLFPTSLNPFSRKRLFFACYFLTQKIQLFFWSLESFWSGNPLFFHELIIPKCCVKHTS